MENYNYTAIRELVGAAFDDEELMILCYDHFRDVAELFTTGQTKRARIQFLIDYARRRGLTDKLLNGIREANPYQHERFESNLTGDAPSVTRSVEQKEAPPRTGDASGKSARVFISYAREDIETTRRL